MNRILLYILLVLPWSSYCQSNPPTCTGLRECIVYARSQDKHQPYRITINGATSTQVNLVTGDSSIWNIHWVEPCGFVMSYLSGNDTLEKGQQHYLKKHSIALKIDMITADYYLYDAYRDRIGHRKYARDTLWMHPH